LEENDFKTREEEGLEEREREREGGGSVREKKRANQEERNTAIDHQDLFES
jgi:hypothetical protein